MANYSAQLVADQASSDTVNDMFRQRTDQIKSKHTPPSIWCLALHWHLWRWAPALPALRSFGWVPTITRGSTIAYGLGGGDHFRAGLFFPLASSLVTDRIWCTIQSQLWPREGSLCIFPHISLIKNTLFFPQAPRVDFLHFRPPPRPTNGGPPRQKTTQSAPGGVGPIMKLSV